MSLGFHTLFEIMTGLPKRGGVGTVEYTMVCSVAITLEQ